MTDKGFSAEWLALRETADARARDEGLVRELTAHLGQRQDLSIIDLGAGGGANLRYLAPKLLSNQRWRLIDKDPALLAQAADGPTPGVEVETQCCDMAAELDKLDIADSDLVTASALMDLVSADWFDRLAARCRDASAALLFTLTYDGTIAFEPIDAEDALVSRLVNQHQGRDKGFGPALGPTAPGHMETTLRRLGYRVYSARSGWQLGPADATLQEALLDGYAEAAQEAAPEATPRLQAWRRRRGEQLAAGNQRLRVGHIDLLALP